MRKAWLVLFVSTPLWIACQNTGSGGSTTSSVNPAEGLWMERTLAAQFRSKDGVTLCGGGLDFPAVMLVSNDGQVISQDDEFVGFKSLTLAADPHFPDAIPTALQDNFLVASFPAESGRKQIEFVRATAGETKEALKQRAHCRDMAKQVLMNQKADGTLPPVAPAQTSETLAPQPAALPLRPDDPINAALYARREIQLIYDQHSRPWWLSPYSTGSVILSVGGIYHAVDRQQTALRLERTLNQQPAMKMIEFGASSARSLELHRQIEAAMEVKQARLGRPLTLDEQAEVIVQHWEAKLARNPDDIEAQQFLRELNRPNWARRWIVLNINRGLNAQIKFFRRKDHPPWWWWRTWLGQIDPQWTQFAPSKVVRFQETNRYNMKVRLRAKEVKSLAAETKVLPRPNTFLTATAVGVGVAVLVAVELGILSPMYAIDNIPQPPFLKEVLKMSDEDLREHLKVWPQDIDRLAAFHSKLEKMLGIEIETAIAEAQ